MRHIVDAHHHLWDLDAVQYPWLMASGVRRFFGDPTPIQKNYLVDDLRDDARDYVLDASVHIQVGVAEGDELRETEWLERAADAEGLPTAIVAFCALEQPDALQQIEAQMANPRVRGLRQIIGRSDEEDAKTGSGGLVSDARWREHFQVIGEMGLSFDLQLTPPQVPAVIDVLADAPDTSVALCHCGSPWDQSGPGLKAWRHGLMRLAELPQVSCKISGLGMFNHGWTVDAIRPIVETCVEIFGPARCMLGSNFPVDKLHADYARVWGAFEDILVDLPADDQAWLFGDTARAFYRIESAS